MLSMFTKYDNIDPTYIPVNVYWPEARNCNEPIAILLTRYAAYGDTFPLVFQVNKEIVDKLSGSLVKLNVKNFRGELITSFETELTEEILKIELTEEQSKLLKPDVYYLELILEIEDKVFTIFDRGCGCLTII